MKGIVVQIVPSQNNKTHGSAGLKCHVPGGMVTISNVASSTGGINPDNLLETDTR